jgi:anti-sigma factor RsiW
MTHLGDRVSALVDGELGHEARERALAHVAHCADCRADLAAERAVKALLTSAAAPEPPQSLVDALQALAEPGGPLPPRARTMPQGPVVPDLPPPGRSPRGERRDSRRPGASRARRRTRVLTAGALSAAGLVLATAFVAGGTAASGGPVVPPVAELSVEHSRTSNAVTVGDPGAAFMMSTVGGLATTPPRR